MRPEEWILGLLHTALHHLRQRLHRCLLSTLEPGLGQEGADHHLQGPSPGQMVVLCRAGGCFTATPALETHLITCDVENKWLMTVQMMGWLRGRCSKRCTRAGLVYLNKVFRMYENNLSSYFCLLARERIRKYAEHKRNQLVIPAFYPMSQFSLCDTVTWFSNNNLSRRLNSRQRSRRSFLLSSVRKRTLKLLLPLLNSVDPQRPPQNPPYLTTDGCLIY